jgi:hypothetical protein
VNPGEYRYYDAESAIRFQVTNDEKDLHIVLNTSERASIMKILRTGLTFYFDKEGKKDKEVYFQYPLSQKDQLDNGTLKRNAAGQRHGFDLDILLSEIPQKALFVDNGKQEKINLSSPESGIKATLEHKGEEFTYNLFFPFKMISEAGINSLDKLRVGIVSGKFEIPTGRNKGFSDERSEGGNFNADRPQGERPGGGNYGGQRQGGENFGYGRPGGTNMSTMTKAIDFWFGLSLFKAF